MQNALIDRNGQPISAMVGLAGLSVVGATLAREQEAETVRAKVRTHTRKGRDGWIAESNYPLGGHRLLKVSTWKGSYGGVSTSASVCEVNSDGSSVIALFADYSKTIITDRGVRCTEKTVTQQHATALAMLPDVVREVTDFYVRKDAKDAETKAAYAEHAAYLT